MSKLPEPKFRRFADSVRLKRNHWVRGHVKDYYYDKKRKEYMYLISNPYTMKDDNRPIPESELERVY